MNHFIQSLPLYLGPLGAWAYVIVALVVFLETVIGIGQFLPGSLFLAFTGSLCYLKMFDIWIMFPGVFLGHYLGELLNYYLGRYQARRLFTPGSKVFRPEILLATEKRLTDGGVKILLVSQFSGVFRPIVSVAAGATHYPFVRFVVVMAMGALFWSGAHLGIGYIFGASWEKASHYFETFMLLLAGLIVAVVLWGHFSGRIIEKTTLELGQTKNNDSPTERP